MKKIISVFIPFGLVFIFFLGAYYFSFKDIFSVFQNTEYPGKRIITGGTFSMQHFLSGFYDFKFQNYSIPPAILGENTSEAASFFLFSPILLPLLVFSLARNFIKRKQIDFVILFLIFYLGLITTWLFIGLPDFVAKIFLFQIIPLQRLMMGVGLVDIILVLYFFNNYLLDKRIVKKIYVLGIFIACAILLLYLYIGSYLSFYYPSFLENKESFLIALFISICAFLIILKKQTVFLLFLLIFSFWSTYKVNPVYKGLNVMDSSQLSYAIQNIENTNFQHKRWVIYDSPILPEYVLANGVHVLNGVQLYPVETFWKKLDKEKKYVPLYNRYTHVLFSTNKPNQIDMNLNRYEFITVSIHPCNKLLKEFNVDYFVFLNKVSYECLNQITSVKFPAMAVYIYMRKN